jgi:hypothetical protein
MGYDRECQQSGHCSWERDQKHHSMAPGAAAATPEGAGQHHAGRADGPHEAQRELTEPELTGEWGEDRVDHLLPGDQAENGQADKQDRPPTSGVLASAQD